MELYSINTGNFKIDGGAMFGVMPKKIWQKEYPADENNLCNCAIRSLLVITDSKKIIIDTGIGNKQDEHFLKHYQLNGDFNLIKSLKKLNILPADITDIIHTHLHFDHCGGTINNENGNLELTFPNANLWCSKLQWECALNPNRREKPSYLSENFLLMNKSGKLKLVENNQFICSEIELRIFNGHTAGLMLPFINFNNKIIVFAGDLIPVKSNISLSYISAYDVLPLTTLSEKDCLLNEAFINNYLLFFQHDLLNECCNLIKTEKGIRGGTSIKLCDI